LCRMGLPGRRMERTRSIHPTRRLRRNPPRSGEGFATGSGLFFSKIVAAGRTAISFPALGKVALLRRMGSPGRRIKRTRSIRPARRLRRHPPGSGEGFATGSGLFFSKITVAGSIAISFPPPGKVAPLRRMGSPGRRIQRTQSIRPARRLRRHPPGSGEGFGTDFIHSRRAPTGGEPWP